MRGEAINLKDPTYTPVRLLNETGFLLGCLNDAALALALDVNISQLSRIRHRKEPLSFRVIVLIADCTGWSVQHIRTLAGLPFDGPVALVVAVQSVRASVVMDIGPNLAACCSRRRGRDSRLQRWERIVSAIPVMQGAIGAH